MSRFDLDDRRRSLQRFFALGFDQLDTAYDWQAQRAEIVDDARPAALIEPSTTVVRMGDGMPRMGEQPAFGVGADIHQQQTFAVVLYPEFSTDEDPRVARHRADTHAQLLDDIVTVGLVDSTTGVAISMPDCIPVHDFSETALVGDDRAEIPEDPYGWLLVEDWSVQPLQDPLDERRWSVPATLRVSWWKPARTEATTPVTETMPVGWHGTIEVP